MSVFLENHGSRIAKCLTCTLRSYDAMITKNDTSNSFLLYRTPEPFKEWIYSYTEEILKQPVYFWSIKIEPSRLFSFCTYFICKIYYRDAVTKDVFTQTFYRRLRRYSRENVPDLVIAGDDEVKHLDRWFNEEKHP